eukprot:8166309-Pyramimonas_sp.AAC.1
MCDDNLFPVPQRCSAMFFVCASRISLAGPPKGCGIFRTPLGFWRLLGGLESRRKGVSGCAGACWA